jgi:MFS family permease
MRIESNRSRFDQLRELRRSLALAHLNAAIWAIGNGLVSTTLLTYLALGRGASDLAVSLILASPRFAGLLRLVVPAVMARLNRRKAFCIATYLASTAVLFVVPIAAYAGLSQGTAPTIAVLVSAWCIYHLLEYSGTIALWSWLGDLAPRRVFGRFCGYRERWLVAGRIAGIAATVALAWWWGQSLPQDQRWRPLAASAAAGALLMAVSVVPLLLMPAIDDMPSAVPRTPWRTVLRATFERPYRGLVFFSCYLSFVHGITASVQAIYPWRVLNVSYWAMQSLQGTMRVGQTALAPTMGRWCDQWGSRPVMIISLLIVATGPLFFVAATPDCWWWLIGAYVAWMAYAGLNVGFDSAKLKLAPADNTAPYLAVYYALADFVFATTTVATGLCIGRLVSADYDPIRVYGGVLLAGFLGRVLGVPLLMRLQEPGAKRLREILSR